MVSFFFIDSSPHRGARGAIGLLGQGEGKSVWVWVASYQALGWWGTSWVLQSPSEGLGVLPTQDRKDFEILPFCGMRKPCSTRHYSSEDMLGSSQGNWKNS